jgi:hypothetical protein
MNKRLITTHPLFRLARLLLPEGLLLHWFGRRVPLRTAAGRRA